MSGTSSASSGVCRPTTAATVSSGNSVTCARVTTGVPMAPKATGAVLATRATTAALTGSKPSATSITEQIATGAPNPANASRSAPKQNAITSACTRGSSESRPKERRSTSKWSVPTVIRYTHRALTTIHRMGKRPNSAPWAAPDRVCPTVMSYAPQVTSPATARPASPARGARTRAASSRVRTVASGRAATSADRASEPATGSSCGTNKRTSRVGGMVVSATRRRQHGMDATGPRPRPPGCRAPRAVPRGRDSGPGRRGPSQPGQPLRNLAAPDGPSAGRGHLGAGTFAANWPT